MSVKPIQESRILIVDDQASNLQLLEKLLAREGLQQIVSTTDPECVLDLFSAFDPDLILLDLMMPKLSGYAVLEQLGRLKDPLDFRPILVLTADATIGAKRRALALGAKDFLAKPFDAVEAMLRVWNLLETRWMFQNLRQTMPEAALQLRTHP